MPESVSLRYARALAEVLGAHGDFARAWRDLEAFASVYRESVELREAFDSPAVKSEEKLGVLNAILERLQPSIETGNFLRVLLGNYRINKLEEILRDFQSIARDELGVVEMRVTSASPLSAGEQESLSTRFRDITQKKVEIQWALDPALVGGVVAQIKSVIYDGSVRGSLERFREEIAAKG
ncbi:MAG: ATP synthase F1 subunit delta [Acidobacteriota bacterium]|nr:ATP synthase F1 subunit delta [Acidobacteriota bacterium]